MGDDERNGIEGIDSGSSQGGDDDVQIEFVDHEEPPARPQRPPTAKQEPPRPAASRQEPPEPVRETGIIEIDVDAELAREAELTASVAKLKDQLLRARADFENYRKRSERDLAENVRRAVAQSLKEILPVMDSLERAVTALELEAPAEWCQGVEAVRKQFGDALARLEVEKVGAVGEMFDPQIHEAMMTVVLPDLPSGTVAAVLEPGYTLQGKLLRPARVQVNRVPESDEGGEGA